MKIWRMWRIVSLLMIGAAGGGCSTSAANMAAKQPERIELDVLKKGTHKTLIVARLGRAADSLLYGKDETQQTVEIYNFLQGYSAASRTARVFGHSVMSVATVGLWEVTGQAIEGYARGTRVSVKVTFDNNDRLESFCVLEGRDALVGYGDSDAVAPLCRERDRKNAEVASRS